MMMVVMMMTMMMLMAMLMMMWMMVRVGFTDNSRTHDRESSSYLAHHSPAPIKSLKKMLHAKQNLFLKMLQTNQTTKVRGRTNIQEY